MGWFLQQPKRGLPTHRFSSPSGDGLVPIKVGLINGRHQLPFSSPSGDGLVLEWYDRNKFVCEFSSPLGDGLVQFIPDDNSLDIWVFVPAWG